MKIGVVTTPVFRLGSTGLSGYGGLEHIAWQCAVGLAKKGHNVTFFAPDGSDAPGCQLFHFGPERQIDEKTAFDKYWPHLLSQDVIISHDWQKYAYLLKAEGRLKCPVLGVCHAPIPGMFEKPPPVEKPCIVCISDDQRAHYEALHSPSKARTCHNGVDGAVYRPLGLPRTDRYLFLARFSTIKGPNTAIDACKEVNAGLDMIGDTTITNEPALIQYCKKRADGKRIRIVGNQLRGSCVWWMSQSKALLHTAKTFREPFGLAPVEAQLCGNPVIAFDYGACRETIKQGETGFLVENEKQLVRLLKDDAASTIKRERCREWASQFSVDRMVRRYAELCEEAIAGGW